MIGSRWTSWGRRTCRRWLHSFTTRSFGSSSVADGSVHVPVLLEPTLNLWQHSEARYFVDGTVGFGGHSSALLARDPSIQLLCIDRDPQILEMARRRLDAFGSRVHFCLGSYRDLPRHLEDHQFPSEVDGILVDLGVNSFHLDHGERGFSLQHNGPLDMRFNPQEEGAITAAHIVNTFSEVELTQLFREYGEEVRLAKEFAKAIVREREEKRVVFETTHQLRDCIERIANKWRKRGRIHPATQCFQALRIAVNQELEHVQDGVRMLADTLAPNGRLVTIAFHSLEDRPIKRLFRDLSAQDDDAHKQFRLVRRKNLQAPKHEIEENPRARSARLRCLERVR